MWPARKRDDGGFVVPTRLLALCISAVAMAALVFVANDAAAPRTPEATTAQSRPSASPTPTPSPTPSTAPVKKKAKKRKPVKRGETYVEVYNNTRIAGLAGGVAGKASAVGWNVVATDNWYGTVGTTAVYFPPRLKREARLLAQDLGVRQIKQAQEPMRFDRLTVILATDYR